MRFFQGWLEGEGEWVGRAISGAKELLLCVMLFDVYELYNDGEPLDTDIFAFLLGVTMGPIFSRQKQEQQQEEQQQVFRTRL